MSPWPSDLFKINAENNIATNLEAIVKVPSLWIMDICLTIDEFQAQVGGSFWILLKVKNKDTWKTLFEFLNLKQFFILISLFLTLNVFLL